jgi:hypothetical protein
MFIEDKKIIIENIIEKSKHKEILLNRFKSLNESEINYVAEKLNISENINVLTEAGVIGNLAGIFFIGPHWWLLYRSISAIFDKHKRKCGIYTISNRRDLCILESKIEYEKNKIKFLQKLKNDKTTTPEKKKKIEEEIKKMNEKIQNMQYKANNLKLSRDI